MLVLLFGFCVVGIVNDSDVDEAESSPVYGSRGLGFRFGFGLEQV